MTGDRTPSGPDADGTHEPTLPFSTPPAELDRMKVGRAWVRAGERVRIGPSRRGKRDGFDATFRRALVDLHGRVLHVEVYGGPGGRAAMRTLRPERVRGPARGPSR